MKTSSQLSLEPYVTKVHKKSRTAKRSGRWCSKSRPSGRCAVPLGSTTRPKVHKTPRKYTITHRKYTNRPRKYTMNPRKYTTPIKTRFSQYYLVISELCNYPTSKTPREYYEISPKTLPRLSQPPKIPPRLARLFDAFRRA